MGIVKIDDLHEEARRASTVTCRSITAQAGLRAEANPTLSVNEVAAMPLAAAQVRLADVAAA